MSIYKIFAHKFNLEIDEEKSFVNNMWNILEVRQFVQDMALGVSSVVVSFGKSLILIIIMFSFLLFEIKGLKRRITNSVKDKNKKTVLNISQQIGEDVVHFISIKFFILFLILFQPLVQLFRL